MMIKIAALNDFGGEIEFVTITDLDLKDKPEEAKLVRQAFRLLAGALEDAGMKD